MDMIAQSLEHVVGYRRKCRSFRFFFILSAIAVRNRDTLSKKGKIYRDVAGLLCLGEDSFALHSKRKHLETDER